MTRLFFRWTRNFFESFVRWLFSMTKMRSAHSIHSGVSGSSASGFMPAEATSMPGYDENVFSAVGLRMRFWPQIKRMRFISRAQGGRGAILGTSRGCKSICDLTPFPSTPARRSGDDATVDRVGAAKGQAGFWVCRHDEHRHESERRHEGDGKDKPSSGHHRGYAQAGQ